MSTALENKLTQIYNEKNSKVIPSNIKKDVQIFDVIGTYEGGGLVEKDVNFYDYDGTLIASYSKTDFLALSELPANPTHDGLTAQGWNWTLSDAKARVTAGGKLDIGQIYKTTSNLTEIYIDINSHVPNGLYFQLKMNGTKDWGDGTTDTETSHTYARAGSYKITCNGTINSLSVSAGLFGQSNNNYDYCVKRVHFSNLITDVKNYTFNGCRSLSVLTVPNEVTALGVSMFNYCYSLKHFNVPTDVTSIGNTCFYYDYALAIITIPKGVLTFGGNVFYYNYSLKRIFVPDVTSIGNNSWNTCYGLTYYDFSGSTDVPSIGSATFSTINEIAKIVVPDSLYTTWVGTSNWSSLANYIVKASEV